VTTAVDNRSGDPGAHGRGRWPVLRRSAGRDGRSAAPPERWGLRALWVTLAAPGAVWLIILFVVPFYVMLAVAAGSVNLLLQSPVPVWNPLHWSGSSFAAVWHDIVGPQAFLGPPIVRTFVYTAIAAVLSLAIAYPVAYFVTRYAGRRKTLFLVLLIAPFWVSYMMRMLAWIDLLQQNGYVNRVLSLLHLVGHQVNWLGGEHQPSFSGSSTATSPTSSSCCSPASTGSTPACSKLPATSGSGGGGPSGG